MTFDSETLYPIAVESIKENNLFWIDDVIAFLPCSKSTFYELFKSDSDELDDLKELLYANRINLKVKLRKKWEDSENATLQMGLMKLIATQDERKKLSQTYQDHTTNGKSIIESREKRQELKDRILKKANESGQSK